MKHAAGIGLPDEARQYVQGGDFKSWLTLSPGKRLLAATIAWMPNLGKDDENPNPAYTLGRAMAIQSGGHQQLVGPRKY